MLRRVLNQAELFNKQGFLPAHIRALKLIAFHNGISASELASRMLISNSNLTPVIDKLAADGMVVRKNDPSDRRRVNITITDTGWAYLKKVDETLIERTQRALASLPNEDIRRLNEACNIFRDVLQRL